MDQWQHTWVASVEAPPKEATSSAVEVWFNDQSHPITLGIVRQKRGILLVSAELGLAYRLPSATELLQIPTAK